MNYIIHADDYGRSMGITNDILDCFDSGILNSTSIVPNGDAFDYAIQEYKKRPELRLSIHIDIGEGRPVSNPKDICMLVNRYGEFAYSFVSLWFKYITSSQEKQKIIKKQLKNEISLQVKKVIEKIGKDKEINIDSHYHMHLIPFVFDILIELKDEFNFSYIRLAKEPFFISAKTSLVKCMNINLIKHVVLNFLSGRYEKTLCTRGIKYSDYFIGVLFTGKMSESIVRLASSYIRGHYKKATIEFLFHPGMARTGEESIWRRKKKLLAYYFSPRRKIERETIKKVSIKELLQSHATEQNENLFGNG